MIYGKTVNSVFQMKDDNGIEVFSSDLLFVSPFLTAKFHILSGS